MYNQNSSTAHNLRAFDHMLFSLCFISLLIFAFVILSVRQHPSPSCADDFPLSNAIESLDWLFFRPYWVSSQRSEVWFQSEQPVTLCRPPPFHEAHI